jgi:large-conductance mechanosensitive channel
MDWTQWGPEPFYAYNTDEGMETTVILPEFLPDGDHEYSVFGIADTSSYSIDYNYMVLKDGESGNSDEGIKGDSGLSIVVVAGGIIGAVIVFVILIVLVLIFFSVRRKSKKKDEPEEEKKTSLVDEVLKEEESLTADMAVQNQVSETVSDTPPPPDELQSTQPQKQELGEDARDFPETAPAVGEFAERKDFTEPPVPDEAVEDTEEDTKDREKEGYDPGIDDLFSQLDDQ